VIAAGWNKVVEISRDFRAGEALLFFGCFEDAVW
jgi:hypothetical protein